jgi:ubiquinone/menaquinone biosynthesis C-methylase UbiE
MPNTVTTDVVSKPVREMYMNWPYPNYAREERERIFGAELTRYRFLGLEEFLPSARIVDVGCGTGHRVIPIAKYFNVAEYVGVDRSVQSLNLARELARQLKLPRYTFIEGDVFTLPFPDASFDIVISQGVLHHTSEPYRGFRELVRVCRAGGFVDVYLYNKWNHWRHNLQKAKVNRLAGADLLRRFEVAHRLYGKKRVEEMSPAEVAGFYDQYCHPHKSDHTVGEILAWFREQGLTYWGSYPALGFVDFLAMMQYRGRLLEQHPFFHSAVTSRVVSMARKLPPAQTNGPPFTRPRLQHQAFWQIAYALQGCTGRYSGGPALCARKCALPSTNA